MCVDLHHTIPYWVACFGMLWTLLVTSHLSLLFVCCLCFLSSLCMLSLLSLFSLYVVSSLLVSFASAWSSVQGHWNSILPTHLFKCFSNMKLQLNSFARETDWLQKNDACLIFVQLCYCETCCTTDLHNL